MYPRSPLPAPLGQASDTNGLINVNWIYFMVMVVVGAFLITNLVLGVLSGQFTKEGEKLANQRTYMRSKTSAQDKFQLENYHEWLFKADQFPKYGSQAAIRISLLLPVLPVLPVLPFLFGAPRSCAHSCASAWCAALLVTAPLVNLQATRFYPKPVRATRGDPAV